MWLCLDVVCTCIWILESSLGSMEQEWTLIVEFTDRNNVEPLEWDCLHYCANDIYRCLIL